jgi:hypothetical protein
MGKCFSVLVFGLVLLASSCRKDSGSTVTVQSLAGTYEFSRMTSQKGNAAEEDVTHVYFNDCAKDDRIILSTTRSYTIVDAGISCGGGDRVSMWELLDASTIKLGNDIYTIRKFDSKNLELSRTGTDRGISTTFVTYYLKQ